MCVVVLFAKAQIQVPGRVGPAVAVFLASMAEETVRVVIPGRMRRSCFEPVSFGVVARSGRLIRLGIRHDEPKVVLSCKVRGKVSSDWSTRTVNSSTE